MEKQEIVQLIKDNSNLTYYQLRQQAEDGGVDLALFDDAWKESHKSHLVAKILIPLLFFALLGGGFFVSRLMMTDFPYEITFELREEPIGDDESEFYAYLKTVIDISAEGEEDFIDYDQSLKDSRIQLSLTGTKSEPDSTPNLKPVDPEDWTATSLILLELEEGENFLSITNGFNTDRYKITLNSTDMELTIDEFSLFKHSLSAPEGTSFERNLPVGIKYPDFATNPEAQKELIEFALDYPPRLQKIENPTEELQLAVIEERLEDIYYIQNLSESVQVAAVKLTIDKGFQTPEIVEFVQKLKKPADEAFIAIIDFNPEAIQFIEDPSVKVQLAAVNADPNVIQYIKDPIKEVQLAAYESIGDYVEGRARVLDKLDRWFHIDEKGNRKSAETFREIRDFSEGRAAVLDKQGWLHINLEGERVYSEKYFSVGDYENGRARVTYGNKRDGFIDLEGKPMATDYNDLPEEDQIDVVKVDPIAMRHIKEPSEAVQLSAVQAFPESIRFIKFPSESAQLKAVKLDKFNIQFIREPTKEVVSLAALTDADLIALEAMQIEAIRKDRYHFGFIQNRELITEKVQLEAVAAWPRNVSYMLNPSEAVQLAAIEGDPSVFPSIREPTEKAKALFDEMN